jgi:predicted phosphoribosyltransferase
MIVACAQAMRREVFRNRREAGAALARKLEHHKGRDDVVVLGLPRGGVPVAFEVARALGAPLDVLLVRKLGAPGQRELAMGAIATGGVRVLNEEVIAWHGVSLDEIESVARIEAAELGRREQAYREGRPGAEVKDRVVLIIDDGLATGSTMKAAVKALRARSPARIVVAVPVGPPESCRELSSLADEVVCVSQPDSFFAVGQWYIDFSQTSDEEVCALLRADYSARTGTV